MTRLGLTVQADPNEVGPRGAVYGWQVVRADGTVVYRHSDKVACLGFIRGYQARDEDLTP